MNSTNRKKTFRADTEGVKKLTRSAQRKLTVTCIAVAAIALILLGAGLNYFGHRDAESGSLSMEDIQNSLAGQMKQEMALAAEYLEKLDGDIGENQSRLDEVNRQLAERQASLLEVETTRKLLEENASDISVKVQELEKNTETQVSTLQKSMESIHEEIRSNLEKITAIIEILEGAEQENTGNHEQAMEELTRVNVSVQEVNTSVSQLEDDLNRSYQSLSALMKQLNAEEESLRALAESLQKEQRSDQTAILQEFAEMKKLLAQVESDLKALLEADMAQISTAFSALTQEFQLRMSTLSQLVEGNFETLDRNMTGKLTSLGENMEGSFADLGQSLSGGFDGLEQEMNGNFASLDQNLSEALENLGLELDGQFLAVNQTLVKQIGNLVSESGENNDALMAYLDALHNALKQDLNQVFTSVSDGKAGLASALLTKGVTVKDDASFAQIRDAILSIDQKLLIGVQEIPGTISYEYHYHTDGAGEYPHTESSSEKGGCFMTAQRHYHTGSCYRTERYHTHTEDCPMHGIWVDWVEEPYWGGVYDCENLPLNSTRKVLECTIGEGTVTGYQPSCGLVDGQITGAHIVYDKEAVGTSAASYAEPVGAQAVCGQEEAAGTEELPPRMPGEPEEETGHTEEEAEEESTGEEAAGEEAAGEEAAEGAEASDEEETKNGAAEQEEPASKPDEADREQPFGSEPVETEQEAEGEGTKTEQDMENEVPEEKQSAEA